MVLGATASPPSSSVEQYLLAMRTRWQTRQRQPDPDRGPTTHELLQSSFLKDRPAERRANHNDPASRLLGGAGYRVVLGSYRILERLGAGGMGQVYKAEHLLMKRMVALKVVSSPGRPDNDLLERFHREVQISAQLQHPNIIVAHDAGQSDDYHFLVMEYADGVDLGWMVRELGPLPIPLARACIRQAGMGLQHAMERGLVHGDIKPSNLILLRDAALPALGQGEQTTKAILKILDFGLARSAGTPLRAAPGSAAEFEGCAGTPDFMPPEHGLDGASADIRGDLYSLGCTFYYLVTGHVPFPGGSWSEKLLRHQFDPPKPVRELRPDVEPKLSAVIEKLMRKEIGDRYQRPLELIRAIDEAQARPQHDSVPNLNLMTSTPKEHSKPSMHPVGSSLEIRQVAMPILEGFDAENREAVHSLPVSYAPPLAPLPEERALNPIWAWRLTALLLLVALTATCWAYRRDVGRWLGPWLQSIGKTSQDSGYYIVERLPDQRWKTWEQALQAANDGDLVRVHGDGPFRCRHVQLAGKRLRIVAAAGFRPRIETASVDGDPSWAPLLQTDQDLTIEGLDLAVPLLYPRDARPGTTHLIYSTGRSLKLLGCRFSSPQGSGLIVARGCADVQLEGCRIEADASPLSIEVGGIATTVSLVDTMLEATSPTAAAICLWRAEEGVHPVRLKLDRCQLQASRIVSVDGLVRPLEVSAEQCQIHFQQALLSWSDALSEASVRGLCRWSGSGNRYSGKDSWLTINDTDVGLSRLAAWREYWRTPEASSTDQPFETVGLARSAEAR